MKTLSVSVDEFNEILYPLLATVPAKGGAAELSTVIKILEKLEARSIPDPNSVINEAVGTPPLYKMSGSNRAKFAFEDAEADIIIARLEHGASVLPPMRSRSIPGMKEQLQAEVDEAPAPNSN